MKMCLTMVDKRGIPCVKAFDLDLIDGWIPISRSDIGKGDNFKPHQICGVEFMQPNGATFKWPASRMNYSKMSWTELHEATESATDPKLFAAIEEIKRLRTICQDIVEEINTANAFVRKDADVWDGILTIKELANEYQEEPL